MIENWTLRLNAGDETRIQADNGTGISLAVCDIKCGGLAGRTVADAEQMAADIVARYNAAPRLILAIEEALAAPMIDHSERKRGVYDVLREALRNA